MLWVVVFIAVVLAAGIAGACAVTMAGMMYGHPVGYGPLQRKRWRRDERRFMPGDVREIDEVFLRVTVSPAPTQSDESP